MKDTLKVNKGNMQTVIPYNVDVYSVEFIDGQRIVDIQIIPSAELTFNFRESKQKVLKKYLSRLGYDISGLHWDCERGYAEVYKTNEDKTRFTHIFSLYPEIKNR